MKFTFDKSAMIKEISIAQEIISTKNSTSILSNVLLIAQNNTLTIKVTDMKVNFETKIPVQIEEEGSTIIYCDKFMGILNSLPDGEIEFKQTSNGEENSISVVIKPISKNIEFVMQSMTKEKYPEIFSAEDTSYFEVSSKEIKSMISQTAFAVSEDETRYYLNGVLFEKKDNKLNMVATDGRRLSFASKEILDGVNDFSSVIVHPKVLNIILKHAPEEGNIFIAIYEKMIFFKFGNYKFGSVLIDGKFPEYSRVIPESQKNLFIVQKNELVDALRRVVLMVDKKAGRLFFTISDGVLKVSSSQSNLGSAEEEIPCEYAGEKYVIAMNNRYLEEPLKSVESEKVAFEFTDPSKLKAITMRPEPASDYFHIIMPMQPE